MIKRLIPAAFALTLAAAPSLAAAQESEAEAPTETSTDASIEAPTVPQVLLPLNFDATEDLDNILVLDLSTGKRVEIRLMPSWAPSHVERIKELVRSGFYDGVIFHRVIDGFMAQTGDPTGTGQGGSSLPDLKQEFNSKPHVRGSVSMARATSEDSANSQFFIVFYPRFTLDKNYTNFGRVIRGMGAADGINRGEPPANPTKVLQASIAADGKAPPVITAPAAAAPIEFTAEMLSNSKPQ